MKTQKGKASSKSENIIAFQAYGVGITVKSHCEKILEELYLRLENILPNGFEKIKSEVAEHVFEIFLDNGGRFSLNMGTERIANTDKIEELLAIMDTRIRLTVAEFAKNRVFIHAGVVGWKGKGIVIPARTYRGKTTLVKELTKLGAVYFSDDFAVLDADGFVHPYPKTLSIRGLKGRLEQVEFPVEYFGGEKASEPIPVGMVLFTEYKSEAKWRPRVLSEGKGVMEMLSHTIPIRYNPKFSLKVLNNTANRAIIVKSKRGEAQEFALKLLQYFEDNAF